MVSDPNPAPGARSRKKLVGVGILLAFLIVLLVLWLLGLSIWSSGGMPADP
jgi:hypothetical protein